MENNIRVLIMKVADYGRTDAEYIENSELTDAELNEMYNKGTGVYTLSDFMDLCNSQEFDIESYWVTYIRVKK